MTCRQDAGSQMGMERTLKLARYVRNVLLIENENENEKLC
jgi:hypothetical protein